MNEEELENLCLDWFQEGGWDVLHDPDIALDNGVKLLIVCNNRKTQNLAELTSC